MSVHKTTVHKEDYRTNRADYLIARSPIPKVEPKPKKRPSRPDDLRPIRVPKHRVTGS
ncbi:hypothetical protein GCM10007880_33510 [Mesorhizobium amorphae]|nr:hypothetical protein GCM10007880_33510 [Mesorhizobium amorphae]